MTVRQVHSNSMLAKSFLLLTSTAALAFLLASPIPAAGKINNPPSFSCDNNVCSCSGDADCNNLFSSGLCGDLAACTGPGTVTCTCIRHLTGASSGLRTAPRFSYVIRGINASTGALSLRDPATGTERQVSVPIAAAAKLHVGDRVYLSSAFSIALPENKLGRATSKP